MVFYLFLLTQRPNTGNIPSMRGTCVALLALLVVAAPAAVQAQFEYATNADGISITITNYGGAGGAVTIPTNINGLTVINIGSNAFQLCSNLTSVTIPASVNGIGQEAFSTCINLANVTLFNGITSIGYGAFFGCYNLTNLTIPASVTSIGEQAFLGTGLTSVTIPGGVTNIADFAFDFCMKLTNVTMSYGVTCIGQVAFAFCSSLVSVTIPASVTSISNAAFNYCTNLTSLTIPASVTNINYSAFAECSNLTSVFFTGNSPTVASSNVFSDDTHATAYYLPGTTGWSSSFAGLRAVQWNPLIQAGGGSFGLSNNQFGFNITGTTNIPFVVEACTNLASPVWTPLQTLNLTNGSFYFSEPFQPNSSGRFYRISSP